MSEEITKIWRQAFYRSDGSVRPAAIIHTSDIDSYEQAVYKFVVNEAVRLKGIGQMPNINAKGNKVYWYGLELFDNEEDANKKIFDINEYGRRRE